jgi:hypothetical protein
MSLLANLSSVRAALPAVNVHPHGPGHKKSSQLDFSTDSSSTTAAQIPVGTAQTMFGRLFGALQQLIGVQSAPAASAAAASSSAVAPSANSAAGSSAAVNPKVNLMA